MSKSFQVNFPHRNIRWNTHIGLWHSYLTQCFKQRKVSLKPEPANSSMQGAIFYQSFYNGEVPCGHYKFMKYVYLFM